MTSVSGPRMDPAPLFDLVTGVPPDGAIDVTLPMPLSLAVYMTMLESTGRAAELAALRKVHIEQARETVRRLYAGIGADTSARVRITHIVEQRVPRVNGLRPHLHAFLGVSRADGDQPPIDVERLAALVDDDVYPDYREGLATTTTERGLVWTAAPRELASPTWLTERTAEMRHDDLSCRGPWPCGRQITAGRR